MSDTLVKICGITREEDARLAARRGADAVGLNFSARSKRHCPLDVARRIVEALPPNVLSVGVFVNATRAEIFGVVAATGIQAVQLHGDERPEACLGLPRPVIKALAVADAASIGLADEYPVDTVVLDSGGAGYGGTGERFDWALLQRVRPRARFLVAGGLTPDNVAEAIRSARPYGVDVASGVESAPGVKDPDRLARFIEAAKEA